MKSYILIIITNLSISLAICQVQPKPFSISKDLLLVQFDCKTDVDDLHTVAAFASLVSKTEYAMLNYHAVTGTYGKQEGLYVPANNLFQLAFGNNWTDAHTDREYAIEQVKQRALAALKKGGDLWIAEAGQSDFSAQVIESLMIENPEIKSSKRIHVVQHSDWNEKETTPKYLDYVKINADYHKIPDGNVVGNGTPGFQSTEFTILNEKLSDSKLIDIWQLATTLSNKYNGKEGRYTNEMIAAGGVDFSDLVEVCWILGINDFKESRDFFHYISD